VESLEEMNTFRDTYDHPKVEQEYINHLNRSITHNEILSSNKESPKRKSSGL
jgi:hypothetical protein